MGLLLPYVIRNKAVKIYSGSGVGGSHGVYGGGTFTGTGFRRSRMMQARIEQAAKVLIRTTAIRIPILLISQSALVVGGPVIVAGSRVMPP